jgi:hypothetical protein
MSNQIEVRDDLHTHSVNKDDYDLARLLFEDEVAKGTEPRRGVVNVARQLKTSGYDLAPARAIARAVAIDVLGQDCL